MIKTDEVIHLWARLIGAIILAFSVAAQPRRAVDGATRRN